jgi:hypothetical protein
MTQTQATMAESNCKATIISMAVLAIAISSALHEGVGHGVTAWLRGDIPTELTSNHLSDLHPDRLVDSGGTLINLAAGTVAMFAAHHSARRANLRYFLWLVGCFNLMDGAGYFLFSGILGLGDWQGVIAGLPHYIAWRIGMSVFGAGLYLVVVKIIALQLQPFCADRTEYRSLYNNVGRLPYYAACAFYCLAGAFDPLGIQLFLLSTIPAAFGGNSGLMWADSLLPKISTSTGPPLTISRQPAWWIAATLLGLIYVLVLGRGIHFVQ